MCVCAYVCISDEYVCICVCLCLITSILVYPETKKIVN